MASVASEAANLITQLTLVAGGQSAQREAIIVEEMASHPAAVLQAAILEGLPSGAASLEPNEHRLIVRIAPGCLCCIGHLALTVNLHRLLRHRPQQLYIALNDPQHLTRLREQLCAPEYAAHLHLLRVHALP